MGDGGRTLRMRCRVAALGRGAASRADVLLGISESAEHRALVSDVAAVSQLGDLLLGA